MNYAVLSKKNLTFQNAIFLYILQQWAPNKIHSFKSLNSIMVLAITQFDMDSSSIFSYVLFGQIEEKEGSSNPKFK